MTLEAFLAEINRPFVPCECPTGCSAQPGRVCFLSGFEVPRDYCVNAVGKESHAGGDSKCRT
jgi:hypothetical protein